MKINEVLTLMILLAGTEKMAVSRNFFAVIDQNGGPVLGDSGAVASGYSI